jgi:hypothetical protein
VYTYRLRGTHTPCRTPDGEKYFNPHIFPTFQVEAIEMKRSLLIAVCLALCASAASAQTPNVAVYFDQGLQYQQAVCPTAPIGTVADTLYVVANNFDIWMQRVEFAIYYPPEVMWLGDILPPGATSTGNSATCIGITYTTPLPAFIQAVVLMVSVLWMCDGCVLHQIEYPIDVGPCPGQPWPRAVEWPNLSVHFGVGMRSVICFSTPVQETTWGKVKALYQ